LQKITIDVLSLGLTYKPTAALVPNRGANPLFQISMRATTASKQMWVGLASG
jgi:hypothetical protein